MKQKTELPKRYDEAWKELQEIVAALQSESVGIDDLAGKIERATLLTSYCRERLRQTEEKLEKLLGD